MSHLRIQSRELLESAWDEARGYCYPNPETYPHLWLWDSCFHAIAWAHLGDARGGRELESVMAGQFDNGFVPHMRYAGPTIPRGPHGHASSFTQPPVFVHAARILSEHGLPVSNELLHRLRRALEWLWNHRMGEHDLLFIVHPWEAGTDDSPRWDDWVGTSEWERHRWTAFDLELVPAAQFDDAGVAAGSERFQVVPASFNVLAAHAAVEFATLAGDPHWANRGAALTESIDRHLWDPAEQLWSDLPLVGGGASSGTPTLDGALGALSTTDKSKAFAALEQLSDPARFDAPYGCAFVARSHPAYVADQYWRGSAWMQMNYLVWLAATRWERRDIADRIADVSRRAAIAAGFAEHWNAETGEGLGAIPQTWSALVAAMS